MAEDIGAMKKPMTAKEIDASIGLRLKYMRQDRALTLEKMADVLGIGPQQLWKYENGKNSIRANLLLDFAARLGVSYIYFVAHYDDDAYSEYQLVKAWRALGKRLKASTLKSLIHMGRK
ncbi:MAG: helix-turn-helix transcriptional regulator [Parvibaculum sp.]|nr:helix-turn-helix transcriptional regulator [Parvibaculum sp.]